MTTPAARISPSDLIGQIFDKAPRTRRGYDTDQVDHTITTIRAELRRLHDENDGLRQENDGLRTRLGLLDAKTQGELVTAQAVALLNSVQRQADDLADETEQYCRELTADARTRSTDIVDRARGQAESIIADARHRAVQAGNHAAATVYRSTTAGADHQPQHTQESQREIAYLQAYRRALALQITAVLDALRRDIEQFGVDEPVPASSSGRTPGSPPP